MTPLADMHCHLLGGLDDGPRTVDDAVEMCRIASAEGTRWACATAHQNDRWAAVTPDRIRTATQELAGRLQQEGIALTVYPCAEVMVSPGLVTDWMAGTLLSVADHGRYLLVEMPHGLYVDLRPMARRLAGAGVRLILAHPERHQELLDNAAPLEELVRAGCLVQVSSKSITEPRDKAERRALRGWFRRGLVHVLGSDGHSPHRRPPLLAAAFRQVTSWVGRKAADAIGGGNASAVLDDKPLRVPDPLPPPRRFFFWPWR